MCYPNILRTTPRCHPLTLSLCLSFLLSIYLSIWLCVTSCLQLRYYWEEKPDTGYDRYGDEPFNLVVRSCFVNELWVDVSFVTRPVDRC